MATAFRQVKNGALSTVTGSAFNNTTNPLTFSVQSGHGARFPQPGNGFWATIWNSATYPNPLDDPLMEIVLVTSRTTDSLTASRGQLGTSIVAHTAATQKIQLLVQDQQITDFSTAINTLEDNVPTAATSYSVAWTTTGTQPTVGNGTLTGYYQQVGKEISGFINLTLGSTSTLGTGTWNFSLPFTAATFIPTGTMIGNGYTEDVGSFAYPGDVMLYSTTTVGIGYRNVAASIASHTFLSSPNTPQALAWATGDFTRFNFRYFRT